MKQNVKRDILQNQSTGKWSYVEYNPENSTESFTVLGGEYFDTREEAEDYKERYDLMNSLNSGSFRNNLLKGLLAALVIGIIYYIGIWLFNHTQPLYSFLFIGVVLFILIKFVKL